VGSKHYHRLSYQPLKTYKLLGVYSGEQTLPSLVVSALEDVQAARCL